ncbi:cell envelope integrity protein TolA [Bacillus sp. OTU530]|uniref:cell envelope integrity protein TolA n=1 Tax=Bacillus sp. OTU530 TaxID=3043862 RepID=UPI00313AD60E
MAKQKQKKESNDKIAGRHIEEHYRFNSKRLYLISKVRYGKPSSKVYYAAFDNEGIDIYEFNKTATPQVVLVEQQKWGSFSKVTVDHYFSKSVFNFSGNKDWLLIVDLKGKEAERVIDNFTDIEVHVVPRPAWRKIVGFRSKTNWKMFVASSIYTYILFLILHGMLPRTVDSSLMGFGIIGVLLSLLGLIVGIIRPAYVLPKVKLKTRKRVLYWYSYLVIVFLSMTVVFVQTDAVPKDTNETVSVAANTTPNDKVDNEQKEEAEQKAQQEAAQKAQQEAAQKAQQEAAQKAQQEAAQKAQQEAAQKAQQEAAQKAQQEAAQKAQQEAEQKAQQEAAQKAQQEAEQKAQQEAAQKAQQEAEQKAQQEAAQQAQEQAAREVAATTSSSQNTSASGNNGYVPFQNDPSDDRQTNMSCAGQIKGNANSKIYHVPGGQYYDKTQDDIVWFCSEADAQAAGYRKSKR